MATVIVSGLFGVFHTRTLNAVIIELVDEGSKVKAGDVLLRLNDESIQNAIRGAQDVVTTAVNALDGSTANLNILKKTKKNIKIPKFEGRFEETKRDPHNHIIKIKSSDSDH